MEWLVKQFSRLINVMLFAKWSAILGTWRQVHIQCALLSPFEVRNSQTIVEVENVSEGLQENVRSAN